MTTRYKLPDWLGGHECELVEHDGAATTVKVPTPSGGSAQVTIHNALLTEVDRPLPPEPPSGSAAATDFTVWLRGAYGWFDGFDNAEPENLTWAQLHERHPEVRVLVYNPAADAPELPYRVTNTSVELVNINGNPVVHVSLGISTRSYTPAFADQLDNFGAAIREAARLLRARRRGGASLAELVGG